MIFSAIHSCLIIQYTKAPDVSHNGSVLISSFCLIWTTLSFYLVTYMASTYLLVVTFTLTELKHDFGDYLEFKSMSL